MPPPAPEPSGGRSRLFAFAAIGIVMVLALGVVALVVLSKGEDDKKAASSADAFTFANGSILPIAGNMPTAKPKKAWRTELDCNSTCGLETDGELVFSVEEKNDKHRLEAFSAETGKSVWKTSDFDPGDYGVYADVYAGTVYVTSEKDEDGTSIAAFETSDGTKKWEAQGRWQGLMGDGTLLLSINSGGEDDVETAAVGIDDGKEKWRTAGDVLGSCSGQVLLRRGSGFAVVDAGTGKRSWASSAESDGDVHCLADRVVLVTETAVTAYDIDSGKRAWRNSIEDGVAGSGVEGLVIVTGRNEITAFEASSGKKAWSRKRADEEQENTLEFLLPVGGGKVMTFGDGSVALMSLDDGSLSKFQPSPDVGGAAKDGIVSIDESGEIWASELGTLKERWRIQGEDNADRLVVGNGRVFVLEGDAITAYE